jgi:hypothetical protein
MCICMCIHYLGIFVLGVCIQVTKLLYIVCNTIMGYFSQIGQTKLQCKY